MKRLTLLALVVAPLAATSALAAPPAVFLRQAGMTDNSEIALGQLAEQRGASNMAREMGRTLQRDHRASQSASAPLLQRYHLAPPAGMLPEARAEMRRLEGLRGPAFDREFARFGVTAHQQAIAKFEAQVRSGPRDTAEFARSQLPVLRTHLRMAQDALAHGR